MASPDWQPWHTAAFLDAQRRRRPVVLLLEAAWAPASADAHARVFARPDVAALVAEATVPVRVDVDRRPDIADRYGLGSWPSLLLLTPEGHVLTGGTRLDETLASRLRAAIAAWRTHGLAVPSSPPAGPSSAGPGDLSDPAGDVLAIVRAALADPPDPTAPGAAVTLCAFAHAAVTADPSWASLAVSRLDTAGSAAERDADDERPSPRRLDDEADWVRVLARAIRLEPVPSWHSLLARRVSALRSFRRADGHWRPWTGAGRLVLVDASARACRALLAAAAVTSDDDLAREAIDTLEVVAPVAYGRAAGVSHVIDDGRPQGPVLLDDAMAVAHAALDADAWRDGPVYRDLAEELLQTALARLAHPSGGLVDRVATLAGAGQVGRLADPHLPLVGNAEAARLILRLHGDDPAARARARALLAAVHPVAREAGRFAAPVGLAWIGLDPAGAPTTAW